MSLFDKPILITNTVEDDAARYRYIVTCTNEQALDLLAEAVGDRERMDSLVDALIAEDAAAIRAAASLQETK